MKIRVIIAVVAAAAALATASRVDASGACCLSDGACLDAPDLPICQTIGGVFAGPGTSCSQTSCTGVCCLSNAACLETSELGCLSQEGAFLGLFTDCAGSACNGGCCLPGGICVTAAPTTCHILDGSYLGNGVSCLASDCGVAACCVIDQCVDADHATCSTFGGVHLGDDANCETVECHATSLVMSPPESGVFTLPRFEETGGRHLVRVITRLDADFEFTVMLQNLSDRFPILDPTVHYEVMVKAGLPVFGELHAGVESLASCASVPLLPGEACEIERLLTASPEVAELSDELDDLTSFLGSGEFPIVVDATQGFQFLGSIPFSLTTSESEASWSVQLAYEYSVPNPADVDGDGGVGVVDLITVILAWGPCPPPPAACPPDVNGDGEINVLDMLAVILAWD